MSDVEKIKQLRQSTGAGFKDCGIAIEEAKGDIDKAVEILRVKGISKASKKMSRVAKEGVVAVSGDEIKKSLRKRREKGGCSSWRNYLKDHPEAAKYDWEKEFVKNNK